MKSNEKQRRIRGDWGSLTRKNTGVALLVIVCVVFLAAVTSLIHGGVEAVAENRRKPSSPPPVASHPSSDRSVDQGPRFMLQTPVSVGEGQLTTNDFRWETLTAKGPASGSNPVIGEGSGKPYYDFRDGLPHPYYIAPSKEKSS